MPLSNPTTTPAQPEPAPTRPRVDIVYPVLPPVLDGIGDYTALFARALSAHAYVRILAALGSYDPIEGVEIRPAFSGSSPQGIRKLVESVAADPPDWLLIQFNQFSYGKWGLNPYLPLAIRTLKRRLPNLRVAWMAHEDFVPLTSWKFAVMTTWQRWQFWMLGRQADLVFFSIDPWARRYQSWFPDKPVLHLPVGSNMPNLGFTREAARRHVGIPESTFVAGIFGTVNASRMVPLIRQAAEALSRREDDFLVLYVGPHGNAVRAQLGEVPMKDAGALPAEEVSIHLAAMDLHLTPFIDGVSTRRGSFMAGIQHGLPTVATEGELTDSILSVANREAFLLGPVDRPEEFVAHALRLYEDAALRSRLGTAARALYDSSFAFERVAERFTEAMEAVR